MISGFTVAAYEVFELAAFVLSYKVSADIRYMAVWGVILLFIFLFSVSLHKNALIQMIGIILSILLLVANGIYYSGYSTEKIGEKVYETYTGSMGYGVTEYYEDHGFFVDAHSR